MSIKVIALNKKASHQYEIKESFRAGLVLLGSEVKALREGACHLKDAYVSFVKHEAYLQKAYIGPYKKAFQGGHAPERKRKLLLQKAELNRIRALIDQKKMSCIPLKIYFSKGYVKLDVALGLGKSLFDKRQTLKKSQSQRQIQQALKKKRRS